MRYAMGNMGCGIRDVGRAQRVEGEGSKEDLYRLVKMPATKVALGLKIISDVTELKEDWPIQYHPGGVFQLEASAQ